MDNQKPLPEIPKHAFSTLTADAARHRSRLVQHFLQDEQYINRRKEGWAVAIAEALDELGQCIATHDWLHQLRLANAPQKATKEPMKIPEETPEETGGDAATSTRREEDRDLGEKISSTDETSELLPTAGSSFRPSLSRKDFHKKHLVFCAARLNSRDHALGASDDRPTITPAIGCHFKQGQFEALTGTAYTVIFGNENDLVDPKSLIGGTFLFKGVSTESQQESLCKILKLSIYVHLSLLLEQHLLSDSSAPLTFPRPKLPSPPSDPIARPASSKENDENQPAKKPPKHAGFFSFSSSSSGLLSFLSRTAFPRSRTITPALEQRTSSDLGLQLGSYHLPLRLRRAPLDIGTGGFRRFSIVGERRGQDTAGSLAGTNAAVGAAAGTGAGAGGQGAGAGAEGHAAGSQGGEGAQQAEKPQTPYLHAFDQIQASRTLLSTSPGVDIAPPVLLSQLADVEERRHGMLRLKGDQRTALASMLGWEGKEQGGSGMAGVGGFLRHQGLSVLVARAVPCALGEEPDAGGVDAREVPMMALGAELSGSTGSAGTVDSEAPTTPSTISTVSSTRNSNFLACGQPRRRSYRYWVRDGESDLTLGDALLELVAGAEKPCDFGECKYKRGQHQLRIAHNKVCITLTVSSGEDWGRTTRDGEEEEIETWQSCTVCGEETKRVPASDGTLLFSYGKYLELLVYSPALCNIKPALCEHTKPPLLPWPHLPLSRFNIVRHFKVKSYGVSFSTALVEDLHDIKVPKLQIIRGYSGKTSQDTTYSSLYHSGRGEDDKKQLRREMRGWWEGVYDHIDSLERTLASNESNTTPKLKALPRLPSEDADFEDDATPVPIRHVPPPTPTTPSKASSRTPSSSVSSSDPQTPSQSGPIPSDHFYNTPTVAPYAPPPTPSKSTNADDTVTEKLSNLRYTFQRMEQSVYAQLGRTSTSTLNDIRRSFHAAAKGTEKRVQAWQKKNLVCEEGQPAPEYKGLVDPDWWNEQCHPVPGSSVLVREDDWSSIIAYTLSTTDYLIELANMPLARFGAVTTPETSAYSSSAPNKESTLFSAALGYKLFTVAQQTQPDPDVDGIVWNEPERFTATISRIVHPRDSSSIFRDVMRQKSMDVSSLTNRPAAGQASRASTLAPPPMAYAKPDVGITKNEVDGEMIATMKSKPKKDEDDQSIDKLLLDLESLSGDKDKTPTTHGLYSSPASSTLSTFSKSSKPPSIASFDSMSTIGKSKEDTMKSPPLPLPLPPKDDSKLGKITDGTRAPPPTQTAAGSTISTTISSGLSSAMRFVRRDSGLSGPASPTPKPHHGLLNAEANIITIAEDRPHIKYEWMIGKRIKFTCIVYYAKQFDSLRRRCGIDDTFIQSLATSSAWSAEGGKSKSQFRKTDDERFIIKTLVDAWNVAELQVLLDLAPSYFQYMESTANKATSIAKTMGFFSVEIRNLETGTVQSQADLLVMENLFYGHKISKVFDLKGISGRKVKPRHRGNTAEKTPKTLFDGEWIEGQQKALVLAEPHSRHVLRCALKNDAEFLARSNIMDYSLLVGVAESTKEIICGIVDTIGSYTLGKTLEYKAKQNLSSGKETTVMPPAEYQERFINALEGYFVACPDKWSRPEDTSKLTTDVQGLPTVL